MSDATVLIASFITSLPALAAALLGYLNGRKLAENHADTKQQISTLQETTNGKMEQLLRVTGQSEHAKGVIEGRAQ